MTTFRNSGVALLAAGIIAAPAYGQGQPLEPVALPSAVEQGVDMVYIDREIGGDIRWRNTKLDDVSFARYAGAPLDLIEAINPLYTELRRGLVRYQRQWGGLPQFRLDEGPALQRGDEGKRVTLLRERLGLPVGNAYDDALAGQVTAYQEIHGLKPDGVAGAAVIASLNRGAVHYARLLMINMERARRLPAPGELKRHIIVDAGSARILMYRDDKLVDQMRAVVGSKATQTPMMAAFIRYADVHPYWNVPQDLVVSMVAPAVLREGLGYLSVRKYELFAGWAQDGAPIDPAKVDWQAVKDGTMPIRVRRAPGPGNSMGDIKFMMPNDFGVYLHDTHDKAVFRTDARWVSNGCVRVEDAQRLARWLFGVMPQAPAPDVEQRVTMAEPVAVFSTYFTATAVGEEVRFLDDPYDRDSAVLQRYFGIARPLT